MVCQGCVKGVSEGIIIRDGINLRTDRYDIKGVLRVCQGCVKGLSMVYQGCVNGMSSLCQVCVKGVSRVCQWCVKGVSRVCQKVTSLGMELTLGSKDRLVRPR